MRLEGNLWKRVKSTDEVMKGEVSSEMWFKVEGDEVWGNVEIRRRRRQEWGDCAFEEDGIEAEKGVEKVEKERKRGGGEKTDWKQRKGFGKVEREMKREG